MPTPPPNWPLAYQNIYIYTYAKIFVYICIYIYSTSPTFRKEGSLPLQNTAPTSKLCAKKSPRLKSTPALLHCLSYFLTQSLTSQLDKIFSKKLRLKLMAVFGGVLARLVDSKGKKFSNAELTSNLWGISPEIPPVSSFELKFHHQSQVSLTPFVGSGHRCNKAEYAASIAFQRSRPLNICNAHDPSRQRTIVQSFFCCPIHCVVG